MDAGIEELCAPRHFFALKEPIELRKNEKFVGAYPNETFKITCNIETEHPLIQNQSCSIEVSDHIFVTEVSKARTFAFLHQMEYMKRCGLARGRSLDNAVVIDKNIILNQEGLRYQDEFVRYKLLDCISDFSLLGMPILAHIVVDSSGHAFNHAFLEKFLAKKDSWKTQILPAHNDTHQKSPKSLAI